MAKGRKYTVMKILKNIRRGLKLYFENCSIHGLKYIVESNRHWTERLFWIIVCLFSIYSTKNLVISNWKANQNNAVSFVSDTSFLNWDTDFIAVSVCEAESLDKIDMEGQRLFGETRNTYLDGLISSLTFFDGNCRTCVAQCITGELNCSAAAVDIEMIVREVRTPCERLLANCLWSGDEFECCDEFLPLRTELGTCYSANSMHTIKENGEKKLKMISNRTTGPGAIVFQVSEAANVFLHGRDDVPFINHPQETKVSIDWGSFLKISIQVKEIINDPILDQVSIEQRRCRLEHENNLDTYKFYSFSTCVVNCRAHAQNDLCNCTQHFMPRIPGIEKCDVHGLECLTRNSATLLGLKSENYSKEGLVCNCMPSCSESEITLVSTTVSPNTDSGEEGSFGSKVMVKLESLPSERYKRDVVRSRLDLIVSVGGTAGLFLGASVLSVVELFSYFCLRQRKKRSPDSGRRNSADEYFFRVKKSYRNYY